MSAIYIDPSAPVDGTGTITSPRNVFPTPSADTEYYVKRGTRLIQTATIAVFTGDNNVVIDAYGTGAKPILDGNNTVSANITVSGAGVSNVTIKNMVCMGATGTAYVVNVGGTSDDVLIDGLEIYGVQECLSVTGATVTNCIIQNCIMYSPDMNNQCLEFSTPGAGCKALNNTIVFTGTDRNQTSLFGIYSTGGAAVEINGNTVEGFYNAIETRVDSTTISNNVVSGSYNAGVSLRDVDTCIVEDNVIRTIWNGLQYDGGAGPGAGGGLGVGVYINDVSDACLNNVVRRNQIIDCYQGILDQSDAGGGNDVYDNLIIRPHVNGISYQSDGAIAYIWNNTIIHQPQDTVNPTGHGLVVQSGSATTRVSFRNNIVISDLLGSNIQCISIGGTPGTNFAEVELQNNIYSAAEGTHVAALSGVNYDTIEDWKAAISGVAQITVKDTRSKVVDPLLDAVYRPSWQYTQERGDAPIGSTDVYGVVRRTPGTIGAVETLYPRRLPVPGL